MHRSNRLCHGTIPPVHSLVRVGSMLPGLPCGSYPYSRHPSVRSPPPSVGECLGLLVSVVVVPSPPRPSSPPPPPFLPCICLPVSESVLMHSGSCCCCNCDWHVLPFCIVCTMLRWTARTIVPRSRVPPSSVASAAVAAVGSISRRTAAYDIPNTSGYSCCSNHMVVRYTPVAMSPVALLPR